MTSSTPLPELVRDTRLQATIQGELTIHTRPFGRRRYEKWTRQHILGHGGYGVVWLERRLKDDTQEETPGENRAVKRIDMSGHRSEHYVRELEALAKFSQDKYSGFFVKFFGWYDSPGYLYIAMEYCEHGDLKKYLADSNNVLPEIEVKEIISQVVAAVAMMHEAGFANRDIKPANILIKSKPPNSWWVKVCDMGLSKRIGGAVASTTVRGTPGFMPPELHGFYGNPAAANPFMADMWCLGETAFQALTGRPVFSMLTELGRYQSGTLAFPEEALRRAKAGPAAIDFIRSLMSSHPWERLEALRAAQHPWVRPDPDPAVYNHSLTQPPGPAPYQGPRWQSQFSKAPGDQLTQASGQWTVSIPTGMNPNFWATVSTASSILSPGQNRNSGSTELSRTTGQPESTEPAPRRDGIRRPAKIEPSLQAVLQTDGDLTIAEREENPEPSHVSMKLGNGPPRRSRTKSRKGCDTCKRRHIRCDENFPQCRNCTKRKIRCPYNDVPVLQDRAGSPDKPDLMWTPEVEATIEQWRRTGMFPFPSLGVYPAPAPQLLSLEDLRLIHHVASISQQMQELDANDFTLWTRQIPTLIRIGATHPYVLHALLSFSAMHLAYLTGCPVVGNMAYEHRGIAFKRLQGAIETFSPETSDAILAASLVLSWQSTDWRSWTQLMQGTSSIIDAMDSWKHESQFGDFIAKSSTFPIAPSSPTPGRQPSQPREDDLEAFQRALQQLQKLKSSLKNNREDTKPVSQLITFMKGSREVTSSLSVAQQFDRLKPLRTWLFWLPVTHLQRNGASSSALVVIVHYYKAALLMERLFPEIGAAYFGSMIIGPVKEIARRLCAMHNSGRFEGDLQTPLSLMGFPIETVNEFPSWMGWVQPVRTPSFPQFNQSNFYMSEGSGC